MIFDLKLFKKRYNDPCLKFYDSLFPDIQDFLKKSLPLLKDSIADKKEWKKVRKALQMVGKECCIPALYKIKKNPTLLEYERIHSVLESFIPF